MNEIDLDFSTGKFRARGDTIEIFPSYASTGIRIELFGDEIERISEFDPLTGKTILEKMPWSSILPSILLCRRKRSILLLNQ